MELDEAWAKKFRDKLDQGHVWPSLYTFKFIVKAGKEEEIQRLFPTHVHTSRSSAKGNYISLTFQMMMPSSEAVVSVYRKAGAVEGLIAL
jgi:putative lipoic acid-binding regulatory protein